MKVLTARDPETRSADLVAENVDQLKALFPEAFTEGKIDFDVLRQLLAGAVDEREEKYGLNWHGKRRARQLALTPSTGTLRPCPEDSVDWDTTQNLMIEGDNLEVLKLLQKSYAGKVKLIYIDPPYNTGKDFVYPDDFRDNIKNYLELTRQVGDGGRKLSSNTEASGRFHTDWLNMMYPRLKLARTLLAHDGMLFISIDDSELTNLRRLGDEVFGEENFLASLIWRSGRTAAAHFTTEHEYVVAYARSLNTLPLFEFSGSSLVSDRAIKRPSAKNPLSIISFPAGLDFESEDRVFPEEFGDAEPVRVVRGTLAAKNGKLMNDVALEAAWAMADMIKRWLNGEQVYDQKGQRILRFFFKSNGVLQYEKEKGTIHPKTVIDGITTKAGSSEVQKLLDSGVFDFPKPGDLIREFIRLVPDQGSLVMDFFAGSGTTAHAVIAQNAADGASRRYILVQLPEPLDPSNREQRAACQCCDRIGRPRNIAELTKERLRRAANKIRDEHPLFAGDLGFRVFKLDSSNIEAWEPDRDNLDRTLLDSVDHLKAGRTEADVLYELLLKLGLDLCVPIEERTIAGKIVHSVGGGVLVACLAEAIGRGEVELLARGIVEWREELAPAGDTTCVFRDAAFADDVAKTNLAAILQQHGLTNVRSI